MNTNAAIATSATSPGGNGTSAALVDEAFSYVTRTAEWTAVRTNDTTGLLTTSTAAGTTLQAFPAYLDGLEYIQLAQEHRTVEDYSLDVTLAVPTRAYLFVDNRLNGDLDNNSSSNSTDPVLTNELAWIVNDGWARVNTAFMPNGQADYIGQDEGSTVASADLRTHPTTTGSGNGLNNFSAIYTKQFSAGTHVGFLKKQGITNANFYGVAVVEVPEPMTVMLSLLAACGMAAIGRRRPA